MPRLLASRFTTRRLAAVTLGVTLAGIIALAPGGAAASSSQITIIQDAGAVGPAPQVDAVFRTFRVLGADTARIIVPWSQFVADPASARRPAHFDATDPGAYLASTWARYDNAVLSARKYGITVDFAVSGGAPQWAEATVPGGWNPYYAYKPNAAEFGRFLQAVATRYSGHFTPAGASAPLPGVHFWSIFNEPNFGEDLGPQAIDGSRISVAPMRYRAILNAGWRALQVTGHGRDTILIGGFAARGINPHRPTASAPQGNPGDFGQTKPMQFIRTLYCVDSRYRPMRGRAARRVGCPATRAASRRFRAQNPALFKASGIADHAYADNGSPLADGRGDRDFATFPHLGGLARALDRVNRVYRSHRRFPVYNDEYGYITHPPAGAHYVSPARAAVYINQAEYLSWKNRRVASYAQYLLGDPRPIPGNPYVGFASGLIGSGGQKKATYYAFQMPVWMPRTSFSHTHRVEVWGDARPASFMQSDGHGPQSVAIQLQPGGHGAYGTVATAAVSGAAGYFDVRIRFGAGGNVRLAYTFPAQDALLPAGVAGSTVHSRSFPIRTR